MSADNTTAAHDASVDFGMTDANDLEISFFFPEAAVDEILDCDASTPENARQGIADLNYLQLNKIAQDADISCVEADECTELTISGFCACVEDLRDKLVAMTDEQLIERLGLTTEQEKLETQLAFQCMDCEASTIDEYYMVHDHIWDKVVPGRTGKLCIGCLETRIGRQLTAGDFTDAPINLEDLDCKSQRLLSRLGIEASPPVSS